MKLLLQDFHPYYDLKRNVCFLFRDVFGVKSSQMMPVKYIETERDVFIGPVGMHSVVCCCPF